MHRSRRRIASLAALTALVTLVIVAGPVAAGTGSLQLLGTSLDDGWSGWVSFSEDGTRVAYWSDADRQVYVDDLVSGQSILVSTADGTTPADNPPFGFAGYPEISRDGRFVTFTSAATNLDPADTDLVEDVYLKDLETGELTLVSTDASGDKGNGASYGPAPVSDDGTVVAFASSAGNFPPLVSTPPGCPDPENSDCFVPSEVYVKDVGTGELTLVSLGVRDDYQNAVITSPIHLGLSADGSRVAFATSDVMTPDDTDLYYGDVVVRDVGTGDVVLASNAPGAPAMYYVPSLSADGTRVAFQGGVGSSVDVFVRDLAAPAPVLLSQNPDGEPGNEVSQQAVIASDGRSVAFQSRATNLLPQDTDEVDDVYLADLDLGTLALVSQDDAGIKGNKGSDATAVLSGSRVIFASTSTNLDPAVDTLGEFGYFLKQVATEPPPSPDANGDGVLDVLQPDGTPAGAFADATTSPPTIGSIGDVAEGLTVTVADAEAPDGVLVTVDGSGSGRATLSVCGFTVKLAANSSAVLTCGSILVEALTGTVTVEVDGGFISVEVPAGVTATIDDTEVGAEVRDVVGGSVEVTVDGTTTVVEAGPGPTAFAAWAASGFRAPVDAVPVLNSMKAGRAVPLKWHLEDANGHPVTTLTSAAVSVAHLECGLGTTTDAVEQTTAGGSGLQNLGNGDYQLNWKTSAAWSRSCKTMTLDLGGGVVLQARFAFTK